MSTAARRSRISARRCGSPGVAVQPLERLQRIRVFGVLVQHAPVEALGGSAVAGFLVEASRPQRQLARSVGFGAGQRAFNLVRARRGQAAGAGDPLEIVQCAARRRILTQGAAQRRHRARRVVQPIGGDLGDLPQPVGPLGAVVAQIETPFVKRDQLLVVAARLGQRLEDVQRPLPRGVAIQQLDERVARRRDARAPARPRRGTRSARRRHRRAAPRRTAPSAARKSACAAGSLASSASRASTCASSSFSPSLRSTRSSAASTGSSSPGSDCAWRR